jgi:glyoxylase-like metal-dependent hydrolase (beta-lactamase superfamily II)
LTDLGDGIYLVDLMERGIKGRTGSYLIPGSKNAVIETGGSVCLPRILEGLQQLNLKPENVDYIIVTHIHLDHAGGAGTFARLCPNARVVVHPRGGRHLADPTRLIAGARAVYGDDLENLFGEVEPVPADRILTMEDGDSLDLGDRVLTFYHTPGHAKHHFSIHDSVSGGVFTGDTTGVRFHPELTGLEADYILPSTTPTDFDPVAVHKSVQLLRSLQPKKIFHGHFSTSRDVERVFRETERLVDAVAELTENLHRTATTWQDFIAPLKDFVLNDMKQTVGLPKDDTVLDSDITLNAMGLHHWIQNR